MKNEVMNWKLIKKSNSFFLREDIFLLFQSTTE